MTTASSTISNLTTWGTITTLHSDHLPILITYNATNNHRRTFTKKTHTNYHKAQWKEFTQHIEGKIQTFQPVENPHKANKAFTQAILEADKLYIPKGNIPPTCKHQLLPQHIKNAIKHRDNVRKQNPTDHALDQLNREIDKSIIQYKTEKRNEHLATIDKKDARKL